MPDFNPLNPDRRSTQSHGNPPGPAPHDRALDAHSFASGLPRTESDDQSKKEGEPNHARRPFEVEVFGARVVVQDSENEPKLSLYVGERMIGSIPFFSNQAVVDLNKDLRFRYRGWDVLVDRIEPTGTLELEWHVNFSPSLSLDWIWRAAVGLLPVVGGPPAAARLRLHVGSSGSVSGSLSQ